MARRLASVTRKTATLKPGARPRRNIHGNTLACRVGTLPSRIQACSQPKFPSSTHACAGRGLSADKEDGSGALKIILSGCQRPKRQFTKVFLTRIDTETYQNQTAMPKKAPIDPPT